MPIQQKIWTGFVRHTNGQAYYQRPAVDNQCGFELLDDEQSYPGGYGLGRGSWEAIETADLTTEERERLAWLADAS